MPSHPHPNPPPSRGRDRVAGRSRGPLLVLLLIALALTAPLAACGKKGALKPPPGEQTDFPRQYPTS